MDCFAEPVSGPRFTWTRWLAMTIQPHPIPLSDGLSAPSPQTPSRDDLIEGDRLGKRFANRAEPGRRYQRLAIGLSDQIIELDLRAKDGFFWVGTVEIDLHIHISKGDAALLRDEAQRDRRAARKCSLQQLMRPKSLTCSFWRCGICWEGIPVT